MKRALLIVGASLIFVALVVTQVLGNLGVKAIDRVDSGKTRNIKSGQFLAEKGEFEMFEESGEIYITDKTGGNWGTLKFVRNKTGVCVVKWIVGEQEFESYTHPEGVSIQLPDREKIDTKGDLGFAEISCTPSRIKIQIRRLPDLNIELRLE